MPLLAWGKFPSRLPLQRTGPAGRELCPALYCTMRAMLRYTVCVVLHCIVVCLACHRS